MKVHITGLAKCGATRTALKLLNKESKNIILCADNNVEYISTMIKHIHTNDSREIIRNSAIVATTDFEIVMINLNWAVHNSTINTIVLDSIQSYGFDKAKILNKFVDEAIASGVRKQFIITEHVRMNLNFNMSEEGTCAL